MADAVVLYPALGLSHLVPLVELGKRIVTHHPSFSVVVLITTTTTIPQNTASAAATYISRVSSATTAITFHHLPPITLPANSPSQYQELAFQIPQLNNPNVHQALQTLSEQLKLRAFVIDFFCNAAFEVSRSLNLPTYYFFVSSACGLAEFLYFPTIHENTSKSIKDLDTTTYLEFPGIPPIPVSDIPKPWLDRNTSVYKNFLNTATQMAKSSGIIVNTFESIHPRAVEALSDGLCIPNAPTPPIYCVGPLITASGDSSDEDHECLRWLDSQPSRSVVFLCFGTMGLFKAEQLKEMAIGLENSGHRFLWVLRKPPVDARTMRLLAPSEPDLDALLPEGFLDRTRDRGLVVKSWCTQVAVLSHDSVGGFVTQCGWNSVLEAVRGGVPMLGWPLFAEQRLTRVFLVEEMKLALALEESEDGFVSAAELEKRVRELMDSDGGKAVRERVMTMKDSVMAAIEEGGSSRVALAKLAESWTRKSDSG